MIELEVQNFQSIQHASLKVDGFAAIVGKSDIGKSAFVRAVQYALTGALGTDFVRHGPDCDRLVRNTKKCKCLTRVIVRMPTVEVTWEKGDNDNRYKVLRAGASEPEVYEGLGRGTPDFLAPDFQLVKIGDRKELVQIPEQFRPIFLLDQSGPAVADVLSDVARLDRINVAMGMVAKDKKDAQSKRKIREEDVTTLKADLAHYTGLDAVQIQPLVEDLQELGESKDTLDQLDGFIVRATALTTARHALETALKSPVPEAQPLELRSELLYKASKFLEELAEKAPVIRLLSGVDKVVLPDDSALQQTRSSLERVEAFVVRLEIVLGAVGQWQGIEDIPDLDDGPLQKTSASLYRASGLFDRLDVLRKAIRQCQTVEGLVSPDLEPVLEGFEKLNKLDRACVLFEQTLATQQALDEVVSLEDQVLDDMRALGVCPFCDQGIGENHELHREAV